MKKNEIRKIVREHILQEQKSSIDDYKSVFDKLNIRATIKFLKDHIDNLEREESNFNRQLRYDRTNKYNMILHVNNSNNKDLYKTLDEISTILGMISNGVDDVKSRFDKERKKLK